MSQADYDTGKKFYSSREYLKSYESFQKCLQNNFNPQRALIYMCACSLELVDLPKLKDCIDKILKLDPKNTEVYYYQGKYEFHLKHYDEAYKHFTNYVEKNRLSDNQNVAAYECLYDCKMKQGIYNSALDHIDYAGYFDIKDKNKKMWHTIKKVKSMNYLERFEEVVERINLLELKDEVKDIQDELMLQKAIALASLDASDPKANFDECVNICLDYSGSNQEFLYPFALCYYQMGNYDSALETCQDYLKFNANSAEGFLLLGKIYSKKHNIDNALRTFSKSIAVNPKMYNAYLEIAIIYVKIKKYNDAYNQIKNINPTQEETLVALLFLLKKAEICYYLNNTKDGNVIIDQVGELLRGNDIENKLPANILSEAVEVYIKLFHYKGGYDISDFDKGTEQLGSGGYGIVTKGTLKGKEVAVKQYIINPEKRKEKGMTSFFIQCINEMKNHDELSSHPNILKLITVFYANDLIYIITELCSGGNLTSIIHNTSIEMPYKKRIEILIQIADGVKYMHSFRKCYIHHDLKPMNILLLKPYDKNGTNSIKICDFGLTKNTWVYNPCGTMPYISPELFMTRNHNEKVDVYSFGVTMWEMFTRKTPFKGVDSKDISARVINKGRPDTSLYESITPPAIKTLVEKCWDHEMTQRPSMADVYDSLTKLL